LTLEYLGHPLLPELRLDVLQVPQPLGEVGAEVELDLRNLDRGSSQLQMQWGDGTTTGRIV
jgi:hypothetical protein